MYAASIYYPAVRDGEPCGGTRGDLPADAGLRHHLPPPNADKAAAHRRGTHALQTIQDIPGRFDGA
jgi:hypothetical protein